MPGAGSLLYRISIEQATDARTASGAVTKSWSEFLTTLAEIRPISGREYFSAAQIASDVTHRIKTRYHSGVTTDMRVVYGTRVFSIQSAINVDERSRWLHLMCTESA